MNIVQHPLRVARADAIVYLVHNHPRPDYIMDMEDIGITKESRTRSKRSSDSDKIPRSDVGPARATGRPVAQRRGIQSVETGLHLLAALAACGGPVPLSAV